MLRTEKKLKVVRVDQGLNTADISKGRVNAHINCREIIFADKVRQFLQTLNCFVVILIHFPVTTY
jgi:hypothetical protein